MMTSKEGRSFGSSSQHSAMSFRTGPGHDSGITSRKGLTIGHFSAQRKHSSSVLRNKNVSHFDTHTHAYPTACSSARNDLSMPGCRRHFRKLGEPILKAFFVEYLRWLCSDKKRHRLSRQVDECEALPVAPFSPPPQP